VVTGGQSRTIQWEARLGAVEATFAVRPLFSRVVDLHEVRARGVRYAQRPRLDTGAEVPPDAADWPRLSRENPPDPDPDEEARRRKSPGAPWTVRAGRIRCGVEQIWIGRYRIAGAADVDAVLDLVARGPISLPRLEYHLEPGKKKDLKLVRPLAWFEAEKARRTHPG
jgi:hypothetical protein